MRMIIGGTRPAVRDHTLCAIDFDRFLAQDRRAIRSLQLTNSPIHQLLRMEHSHFTRIDVDAERPCGSRALMT